MVTGSGQVVRSTQDGTWGVLGDAVVRSAEMQLAAWGVFTRIAGDLAAGRTPVGEFGRVYWAFTKEVGFRYVAGVAAGCVDSVTRAAELKRDELLRLVELLQEAEDAREK